MTRIQSSADSVENFVARSKAAFDALDAMKANNPPDYLLLRQAGLVNNQNFENYYGKIVSDARSLYTNSPQELSSKLSKERMTLRKGCKEN